MGIANKKLAASKLRNYCDAKKLKFTSTEHLPPLEAVIGQKRALRAISFGLDMVDHGYHMFALGELGTGKTTIIRKFLNKQAKNRPTPEDWLYLNNFDNQDKPKSLRLPAGKGRDLREDMDHLVEELKNNVPQAFESKQYEKERERIEQDFQQRSKELFQNLDKKAEDRSFKLIQTLQGMIALPVVDGQVLSPDQYGNLDEKKRVEIEHQQEDVQTEIREALKQIELLQKDGKEHIQLLDQRVVGFSVDHLINDLKQKYAPFKDVVEFLIETRAHLMKNIQAFKQIKQQEQTPQMPKIAGVGGQEASFDEYRVNLLVDNSKTKGAPVILEKNPTGPNLIGRIEHQGMFGTLVTNFRMIKGGSLHRANGGYLIIEAFDLLQKPFAWQMLKRALKNHEAAIENVGEEYGMMATRSLDPEPIPLDLKIIMIGSPFIYYLLYNYDQAFKELFKVKADFDHSIKRTNSGVNQYAHFIGAVCREEKLLHFAPSGVAKVVEHGSRLVDHQDKLATKFGDIVDLVRQASYWAGKKRHKLVQAEDVQKAIHEKIYRSNSIEEMMQEMIDEGTIMIDTKGKRVGQINGLSVLSMADFAFGRPTKITARAYLGNKGVVNIDREVELGGPIHNKGHLILTSYFNSKYAENIPLALSASITFEQSYQGVEGDSASSTEIYALLSALSNYPIRQDIAVTGSVNQLGKIQPIGGANEKIEGFYTVCKAKGLTGTQGVMIPKTNIKHLMLNEEVVDAVKKGKFHIYAVTTIDEGIEILTGIKAGKQKKDGSYPKDTINAAVQERITEFAFIAKEFNKDSEPAAEQTKTLPKTKSKN
ncbi:MAG: AAA family ATPase [Gammaproteobacteria bacterium]|nr:AAA family ATPase [Gammaproteobacteria bacterium]